MALWVVTGAGRGLGLELARQLRARGEQVVATVRRTEAAAPLEALGARVEALDVADGESVARFGERMSGTPVDVLVNNAGRQYREASIEDLDASELVDVFAVNSVGPLRVLRALLPSLRAGEGRRVVHVTSRMGCFGEYDRPSMVGYRASKAALNMLHRCVADELGPQGWTCVALHPGWVRTGMGGPEADLSPEESVAAMLRVLDRLGPEDNGALLDWQGRALPW